MVSGSEMARLIAEFQSTSDTRKADHKHHEQNKHTQVAFAADVRSLIKVMGELGNPFCDDRKDLMVIDSRPGRPSPYKHCSQIQKLGEEQQDSYVQERLIKQTKPITNPIKRNNLPLFSRPPVREK